MTPARSFPVWPTLLTLGNLACGFFAILAASDTSRDQPWLAGSLILLATALDVADGHVARRTCSTTDFGAHLDSLADLVSFGVAPAVLLVRCGAGSPVVHPVAVLFACLAAIRLARFNADRSIRSDQHVFVGLPAPAAAAVLTASCVLSPNRAGLWLPALAVLIGGLMVSRVRYPHLLRASKKPSET